VLLYSALTSDDYEGFGGKTSPNTRRCHLHGLVRREDGNGERLLAGRLGYLNTQGGPTFVTKYF
jgi:hypothetical protein